MWVACNWSNKIKYPLDCSRSQSLGLYTKRHNAGWLWALHQHDATFVQLWLRTNNGNPWIGLINLTNKRNVLFNGVNSIKDIQGLFAKIWQWFTRAHLGDYITLYSDHWDQTVCASLTHDTATPACRGRRISILESMLFDFWNRFCMNCTYSRYLQTFP
jgi:hypothetical protein